MAFPRLSSWMTRGLLAGFLSSLTIALQFQSLLPKWHRLGPGLGIAAAYTAFLALGFLVLGRWILPDPLPPQRPARQAGLVILRGLVLYLLSLVVLVSLGRALSDPLFAAHPGSYLKLTLIGLGFPGLLFSYDALRAVLDSQRELAQAQARATQAMMRAQLQPHTLLNALNGISALVETDPKAAQQGLEHLGAMLRSILEGGERETWTLEEEFALLETYLRLQRLRMGERLDAALELAPDMAETSIPPLLLLPLVENAFKHGFRRKVGPCRLRVMADGGIITVSDDGTGRAPDAAEGLGLRTVRLRLEAAGGILRWPEGPGCTVRLEVAP